MICGQRRFYAVGEIGLDGSPHPLAQRFKKDRKLICSKYRRHCQQLVTEARDDGGSERRRANGYSVAQRAPIGRASERDQRDQRSQTEGNSTCQEFEDGDEAAEQGCGENESLARDSAKRLEQPVQDEPKHDEIGGSKGEGSIKNRSSIKAC